MLAKKIGREVSRWSGVETDVFINVWSFEEATHYWAGATQGGFLPLTEQLRNQFILEARNSLGLFVTKETFQEVMRTEPTFRFQSFENFPVSEGIDKFNLKLEVKQNMEYVVIYPHVQGGHLSSPQRCLVVKKLKPFWMKGQWNLIGGKIGDMTGGELETPLEAAKRELVEECGKAFPMVEQARHWKLYGDIYGNTPSYRVYVFGCVIPFDGNMARSGINDAGEYMEWMSVRAAIKETTLIQNLRTIIPLVELGVDGWRIWDDEGTGTPDRYRVEMLDRTSFEYIETFAKPNSVGRENREDDAAK